MSLTIYKDSFDRDFYRQIHTSVDAEILAGDRDPDAFQHFEEFGFYEGRVSNFNFNEDYYLEINQDVNAQVQSGIISSGLEHYKQWGYSQDFVAPFNLLPGQANLSGTSNSDILFGSELDNTLFGQAGDDTIFGYEGNDLLYGQEGNDILKGGAGNDSYLYQNDRDWGQDTIEDSAGNFDSLIFKGFGSQEFEYLKESADLIIRRKESFSTISQSTYEVRIQDWFNSKGIESLIFENEHLQLNSNLTIQVDHENRDFNVNSHDTAISDLITNPLVSIDGKELILEGNGWKRLDTNYRLTADTVLQFDFKLESEGEIHAIVFDQDNLINSGDSSRTLRLAGTQAFGNLVSEQYITHDFTDGWISYTIPVKDVLGNSIIDNEEYDLVIANDHDVSDPSASSRFRNFRLNDTNNQLSVKLGSKTDYFSVDSHGGVNSDQITNPTITNNNRELHLEGNGWKRLDTNYSITPQTVLQFDFKLESEGEIHGIIFDDDNLINSGDSFRAMKLAGTQAFGQLVSEEYLTASSSDGWLSYSIPVGEFLGIVVGEEKEYDLVLANDHDVITPTASSQFRNFYLFESQDLFNSSTPASLLQATSEQDSLIGDSGLNTFQFNSLTDSLLSNFDTIQNLEVDKDIIDFTLPIAHSYLYQLGSISSLTESEIQNLLTVGTFRDKHAGATFTFGNRTFLALNDMNPGFSQDQDAVVEITGYQGNLAKLSIS